MKLERAILLLASVLVARTAAASGPGKEGVKGSTGSGTPTVTLPSDPAEGVPPEVVVSARESDVVREYPGNAPPTKPWEVGVGWEFHHLIRQEDLGGAGVNKNLNYFSAYARWDITENNRLSIRGGLYERFIADAGESGVRADDVSATYTRRVPLPRAVTLRIATSLSAPTSFASQKAGLITAPRLSLQADRKFGYVTVDGRIVGQGFLCKYASAEGGSPNPKFLVAGVLTGGVSIPYLNALSVGLSLTTGYVSFYDVANAYVGSVSAPVVTVAQPGQAMQQHYGGEVYLRYALPATHGFKGDVTVALAQGDPTLGYTSVLHDGAQHVMPFYRQTAEVYALVGGRY